jgi:hypothetical protein
LYKLKFKDYWSNILLSYFENVPYCSRLIQKGEGVGVGEGVGEGEDVRVRVRVRVRV